MLLPASLSWLSPLAWGSGLGALALALWLRWFGCSNVRLPPEPCVARSELNARVRLCGDLALQLPLGVRTRYYCCSLIVDETSSLSWPHTIDKPWPCTIDKPWPLPLISHGPVPLTSHGPVPLISNGPVPLISHGPVPLISHGPVPLIGHGPVPLISHGPVSLISHGPVPLISHGPVPLISLGAAVSRVTLSFAAADSCLHP